MLMPILSTCVVNATVVINKLSC